MILVTGVFYYFKTLVLLPLLSGPLAPWGQILTWLWAHGEVSVPLVLMVIAALAWKRTRGRIAWLLDDVLYYGTVVVVGSLALGVVAWAAVKLWPLVWR